MAKARRTQKADPVLEAAVEYFSSRSHDAWRRNFLKANPGERGKPRMRLRGGVMVDVNQPWSKLDPRAQQSNKRAALDAYAAVKKFPNDREAAADFIHECWIKANRKDASQPKALFKPYAKLPEVEKDKDRAHVDIMKKALAAVRKNVDRQTPRKAAKAKRVRTTAGVQIDASAWRRLERAAKDLSKALGREVSAEVLAAAGVEAMVGVCKAVAAKARAKRG